MCKDVQTFFNQCWNKDRNDVIQYDLGKDNI